MYHKTEIHLDPVIVRVRGRFKAIAHTGHTYDRHGNITKFGDVLRETPFGKNVITLLGFQRILANQAVSNTMVVGVGNTTPTETDGTLTSYVGKSSTIATSATTRNATPDINDEVWWRNTTRITFAPGSMGSGTVNVAEAGVVFNASVGAVNSSSPIGSHGLLVDGVGSPTTVSVDNAVEYLDVIWEYTEWVKAGVTGTVTINLDGVDTVHDFDVRPYNFDNVGGSYNYRGWQNAGGLSVPGFAPNSSKSGYPAPAATSAWEGPVGAITTDIFGNATATRVPTAFVVDAYVTGSKQRTFHLTWIPTEANLAGGGIGAVRVNLGHSNWQVGISPKIDKIITKQLDLYFTYAMNNR